VIQPNLELSRMYEGKIKSSREENVLGRMSGSLFDDARCGGGFRCRTNVVASFHQRPTRRTVCRSARRPRPAAAERVDGR